MNKISETIDPIINESDIEKEESFRKRYSQELITKRQQIDDKDRGYNELEDERRKVRQQMMRTPGRRGEIIKEEAPSYADCYESLCVADLGENDFKLDLSTISFCEEDTIDKSCRAQATANADILLVTSES